MAPSISLLSIASQRMGGQRSRENIFAFGPPLLHLRSLMGPLLHEEQFLELGEPLLKTLCLYDKFFNF